MASYMPALTPVIVRPRNTSRLFATPTPGQKDNESDEGALSDKDKQKKDLEATPPAYAADYTQSNNPPTDRAGGDANRDLAGMINGGTTPGSPAEQVAAPTGNNADVVIGPDGRPIIPELIVTGRKGDEMLNILVNDSFST